MGNAKEKNSADLDFEIEFFEKILQRRPDCVELLAALAEHYTFKGRYEDGLKMDLKLSYLKPDDPYVFYNLACSYSLLNCIEKALAAMENAFRLGYRSWNHLLYDDDLINLRRDQRFRAMLLKAKARRS